MSKINIRRIQLQGLWFWAAFSRRKNPHPFVVSRKLGNVFIAAALRRRGTMPTQSNPEEHPA